MSEAGASLAGDQAAAELACWSRGRRQHAEAERRRRQRKASRAGVAAGERSRDQRTPPPSLARGHAAKSIPKFFAIAPDVTSPCGTLRGPRHAIAATPAVRRWSGLAIVNASGYCAIAKWVASNAVLSTRPHDVKRCCGRALLDSPASGRILAPPQALAACGPRLSSGKHFASRLQGFSGDERP